MKNDRIKVGKITTAVGIKGEVKVYPYTDDPERFEELESVYAGDDVMYIDKVRYQKNLVILKFKGVDDRNAAEALRDRYLTIDRSELRELEEDEYFIFDLIGLEAVDQEGNHIGVVSDVIQNTAQDLYEIKKDDGSKYLVPAVYEIVTDIDINSGIMKIDPIDGLFGHPEEVSIGDYILTGGELAAMVVIDATARLIPEVLGNNDSVMEESVYSGLIEYPQYTKPREYEGMGVPEVLLSGNHKVIALWQLEKGCEITKERRPDLWEAFLQDEERLAGLSKQEKKIIEKVFNDRRQAWQKKI